MFSLSLSHRENLAAVVVLTFRLGGRVNVAAAAVVVVVVVVVAVSCYFIDQMIEASYGGKWFYRNTRTQDFPPEISSRISRGRGRGSGQVVRMVASKPRGCELKSTGCGVISATKQDFLLF